MNKEQLQTVIDSIRPLDKQAYTRAEERQAALVKPPGSLGQLEAMSIRLAGITGKVKNEFSKPAVLIMAADNGVVAQGISSAPQSVTISQTINFTRRLTGVGALARTFDVVSWSPMSASTVQYRMRCARMIPGNSTGAESSTARLLWARKISP